METSFITYLYLVWFLPPPSLPLICHFLRRPFSPNPLPRPAHLRRSAAISSFSVTSVFHWIGSWSWPLRVLPLNLDTVTPLAIRDRSPLQETLVRRPPVPPMEEQVIPVARSIVALLVWILLFFFCCKYCPLSIGQLSLWSVITIGSWKIAMHDFLVVSRVLPMKLVYCGSY